MSLISGDEYIEIVSSSLAKGIHPFQSIGMLCMQELFFCRVGGLLETLYLTGLHSYKRKEEY